MPRVRKGSKAHSCLTSRGSPFGQLQDRIYTPRRTKTAAQSGKPGSGSASRLPQIAHLPERVSKGVGTVRRGWSWLRLHVLDPLGAAVTLVGLASVTLAALKWLGIVALAGADPVTVTLLVVGLVLIALGLTRGRPAHPDETETPPPTKAPPLTLADAPAHGLSPVDANRARAMMRGQDPHSPLLAASDAHLYRPDPAEIRRLQEQAEARAHRAWRESVAARLGEGTRLLQKLRGSGDFAAALEDEVREWVTAVQQTLKAEGDKLALFDHHAVNHAVSSARQESQRARPWLDAALMAGTDCLVRFLGADPPSPIAVSALPAGDDRGGPDAAKTHARHLIGELNRSQATVTRALNEGRWWDVRSTGLQSTEWRDARDLLAKHAPSLYDTVDPVYVLVDQLNTWANEDATTFGPAGSLAREAVWPELQCFGEEAHLAVVALRGYYEGYT
jgi:hypothetical protein